MLKKIEHLGIAVKSLESAREFYERVLGFTCQGVEDVPGQKVRVAFFSCGETTIELLEPTDAESPVAKFLEKKGEGFHHVAFHTDDIHAELAHAKSEGARLINETPTTGAHGKQVAFLHPATSHGLLIEFCGKK